MMIIIGDDDDDTNNSDCYLYPAQNTHDRFKGLLVHPTVWSGN